MTERQGEGGEGEKRPSVHSPNTFNSQEQKSTRVSCVGGRSSRIWAVFRCLPECSSSKWHWRQRRQDSSCSSYRRYWCSKQPLNLLHHGASPDATVFQLRNILTSSSRKSHNLPNSIIQHHHFQLGGVCPSCTHTSGIKCILLGILLNHKKGFYGLDWKGFSFFNIS